MASQRERLSAGVTRGTLGLDGSETFDILGVGSGLAPKGELMCTIVHMDGRRQSLGLLARLDTRRELEYYRHGGQLHCVVRNRLEKPA